MPRVALPLNLIALLNQVDAPGRVIAHIAPTRIIRITDVKGDGMTFRVEQLAMTSKAHDPNPRGTGVTLSTHGGQVSGEGLAAAFKFAAGAQEKLVSKLRNRLGTNQSPKAITNGARS